MEQKNETQDVALENNEQVENKSTDNNVDYEAIQAENAKNKRIIEKLNKQLEEAQKAPEQQSAVEKSTTEKSNDLDYGEKAYLRSAIELKGSDELQLAKEFKSKYGMSVEEMESDSVFLGKLQGLREAREAQAAVPKSSNRSGQTGETDVDVAIAKYTETGELPADFETRLKVAKHLEKTEKNRNVFSGPAVMGPRIKRS